MISVTSLGAAVELCKRVESMCCKNVRMLYAMVRIIILTICVAMFAASLS